MSVEETIADTVRKVVREELANTQPTPEALTFKQTAALLGCSPNHVRTLTRKAGLPTVAIGLASPMERILPADLTAWLHTRHTQQETAA